MEQKTKSTANKTRAYRWCYTINNPTSEPILEDVRYHIYGREVGEKEGTKHLQGFVIFYKQLYFSKVKTLLPGAHLEVAKGTNQQAADYCKKDGDFVETGELPLEKVS